MKISRQTIKAYYQDKRYQTYIDVGLFVVLILGMHFIYVPWKDADYWPISAAVWSMFDKASLLLFNQSCAVLNFFNIDISTFEQTICVLNCEGTYSSVTVAPECTSLKQWVHWFILIAAFPGPWKHKLWYIPAGLVVIEFINVVRIVGLVLYQIRFPDGFEFAHDYIFKTLFYFVIFLMWVLWVEKFTHPRKKSSKSEQTIG